MERILDLEPLEKLQAWKQASLWNAVQISHYNEPLQEPGYLQGLQFFSRLDYAAMAGGVHNAKSGGEPHY